MRKVCQGQRQITQPAGILTQAAWPQSLHTVHRVINSQKEPIPGLKPEGGIGEAPMSRTEVRSQGLEEAQNGAAVPPAVGLICIPISIHRVFWRPTQV